MNFLKTLPIIGNIFDKTIDVISEVVVDKDMQAKIKADLSEKMLNADFSLLTREVTSQAEALAAEMGGTSAQRNWRPHLMYLIMFFLAWLIVIVPIFGAFGVDIPVKKALDSVPPQMWMLLTVGVGGYTVFRSAEKMVKAWAGKVSGK